jgi:hypothetical protein
MFGLLGSLWVTRIDTPVEIFTVCLAVQSLVTKLFAHKHIAKDFGHIANKFIISQIVDLLDQRAAHGSTTKITWVRAHTHITTSIEYIMNAEADRLANRDEAREQPECYFNDCIPFAERFYFKDKEGSLIESSPGNLLNRKFLHDFLTKELDSKIRQKNRQQVYHDPTIAYFIEHKAGIWSRASCKLSLSHRSPHLRRFLFEIMTNSLPTIAQQHNLNK